MSVTNVKATFRDGQTFLTWNELNNLPARYRIYRHLRPHAAGDDLDKASLVGEVGSSSSMNKSASFQWNKLDRKMVNLSVSPVYYVIEAGMEPLDSNTGLFVSTAKKSEAAYYTVTSLAEGKESLVVCPGENSTTEPVNEQVMAPQPVLQNHTELYFDYVHWTDSVGTDQYKAMSKIPSVAYNFRVCLPTVTPLADGMPLNVFLHGSTVQYNRGTSWRPDEKTSVTLRLDSPAIKARLHDDQEQKYQSNRGWFSTSNKNRSCPGGEQASRVLWTIQWAEHEFKTNPNKVSLRGASMGGIGALSLGLSYPDRFSVIHAIAPPITDKDRYGKTIKRFMTADFICEHPSKEFPFIILTTGRSDVKFYNSAGLSEHLQANKRGCILYWDLRPHSGPFLGTAPDNLIGPPIYWNRGGGEPMKLLSGFSLNQSYPVLQNFSLNSDKGDVDFSVRSAKRKPYDSLEAGDLIGNHNGYMNWSHKDIVDESNRYEITLFLNKLAIQDKGTADVSIRRKQKFMTLPNETFNYQCIDKKTGSTLNEDSGTADEFGVMTIKNLAILRGGTRLVISRHPL